MYAARAACRIASVPCARRPPNSTTGRPSAAITARAAFDAISVANEIWFSANVSTICASGSGPITCKSGAGGNTAVPSATARISPVNRNPRSRSMNHPSNCGSVPRYASSSSPNRSPRTCSTTRSTPAQIRKFQSRGSPRAVNSNTASRSIPRA